MHWGMAREVLILSVQEILELAPVSHYIIVENKTLHAQQIETSREESSLYCSLNSKKAIKSEQW